MSLLLKASRFFFSGDSYNLNGAIVSLCMSDVDGFFRLLANTHYIRSL